jgi:hypothetical protein
MIKIDWKVFETKFNESTQVNFEWLCSILFCVEFNLSQGVSRYKNQPAVEVEPVKYDNEYVSFQAKYITIPISKYKEKLIQMFKTVKHDYPFLTKILFYTNTEWGKIKGKKPKWQIEIESIANTNNINIEWRTKSFFETTIFIQNESDVFKYFFSNSVNIIDTFNKVEKYSQEIIEKQIRSKKYIPGVFVETGKIKEYFRFFTNQFLFLDKIIEMITKIDMELLYTYLRKEKINIDDYKLTSQEFILSSLIEKHDFHNYVDSLKDKIKSDIFMLKIFSDTQRRKDKFGERSFSHKINIRAFRIYFDLEKIFDCLSIMTSQVIFIVDAAGKGKTNLLCDLFQNYLYKLNIPALFILANSLNVNNYIELEEIILRITNNYQLSFDDFLLMINSECIKTGKIFVFIIDGLNENNNITNFSKALSDFIQKVINYSNIKIICTCRSEYYKERFSNIISSLRENEFIEFDSQINNNRTKKEKERLFRGYMKYYKINPGNIQYPAYEMLSNDPLLLRFFCEAYGNERNDNIVSLPFIVNVNRIEIFDKYQKKKFEYLEETIINIGCAQTKASARRKIIYLFDIIANFMLDNSKYDNIPLSIIEKSDGYDEKIFFTIVDEDIIFRRDIDSIKGVEVINFTFDEYRDYILSIKIFDIIKNDSNIFKEKYNQIFSSYTDHEHLKYHSAKEGIIKYLFLLSKNQKGINLPMILGETEYVKFFSQYIFEVDQSLITDDDIVYLKTIFLETGNSQIITKFILLWNKSLYYSINLELLLSWLMELPQRKLDFYFFNYILNYSNEELIISIFNFCEKNIDNISNENDSENILYNLLIYFFGSTKDYFFEKSINLYHLYCKKYPTYAIKTLIHYLEIKDFTIQEYILGKILFIAYENTDVIFPYVVILMEYIDKNNNKYINNIISRDLLKSTLIIIKNKYSSIISEHDFKMILKINQPIRLLLQEEIKPVRPLEKQNFSLAYIDYDVWKYECSSIANQFGLHRCDFADELIIIMNNLGYNKEVYKTIEKNEERNIRNQQIIPYRKKYLWQAIRILQGMWLDTKPFKHEEDYELTNELIEFQHRKFDHFLSDIQRTEKPTFISLVKLPNNKNINWLNDNRKISKSIQFNINDNDWIILSASCYLSNVSDNIFDGYHVNEYSLNSCFVNNCLLSAYKYASSKKNHINNNDNYTHLDIYINELNLLKELITFDHSSTELIEKFHEIKSTLHISRTFENNNEDNNFNFIVLAHDLVEKMNLKIHSDFSYYYNNQQVTLYYNWHFGYQDRGHILLLRKDILDEYLIKSSKFMFIDIYDGRTIVGSKYSDKVEYIFYPKTIPNNIKNNFIDGTNKMAKTLKIESFEEYYLIYYFCELNKKNISKREKENILNFLLKNYFERKRYKSNYNSLMNIIIDRGDRNEN